MREFIQQNKGNVIGTLSGLDRLVFMRTLRGLAVTAGMMDFLGRMGVLLKEFGSFVEEKSEHLKEASCRRAIQLGRPIRYLPSAQTSMEEVAYGIAEEDGITEGLICVLTSVEVAEEKKLRRAAEAAKKKN
ncbi:MAG TPA: hypothetical protein PL033_21300 [Candidatus Brocadiia bacterium]|nr:hypothetical protein [Candidatus Brocadiia bacterium]